MNSFLLLISAVSANAATRVGSVAGDERPVYAVLAVVLAVCAVKVMTGWAMGNGKDKAESAKLKAEIRTVHCSLITDH